MNQSSSGYLRVAAAVIVGANNRVLLSRRHAEAHQGGLWEFPGGKIEPGERSRDALARELQEELGIHPTRCRPQIQVPYRYPDRDVWLDVWRVDRFEGRPAGREGQSIDWFDPAELDGLAMPAANRPIVDSVRLPAQLAITPAELESVDDVLRGAERILERGGTAILLRLPRMPQARLLELTRRVSSLYESSGAACFVSIAPELFEASGAQGLHLPGRRLLGLAQRPVAESKLLSVSCHDLAQLRQAETIGASCALVSPVRSTRSHPGQPPMGWRVFAAYCRRSRVPIYALGGMRSSDLGEAWVAGGQGVAAINGLWPY